MLLDQTFPIEGGNLKFDFFAPETDGVLSLVVLIHGGGWISGDRSMYRDEALWLVSQGFSCACISYRLAPLYPYPAAVADVQAFIRFARQNSAELGIDPQKIAVLGNSAGGHLAAMAGLCSKSFDPECAAERANAVVNICGISDLRNPHVTHHPISISFLEEFMGGAYQDDEDRWAEASPITWIKDTPPPMLIFHGTEDDVVVIDQSRALERSLTAAGGEVELVELPGEGHSFTWNSWEKMRTRYTDFLDRVFSE